jgi:hypothetical protein
MSASDRGLAGEIGVLAQDARQDGEHVLAPRQSRRDDRFVGRRSEEPGKDDPLHADGVADAVEQIAVVDVHRLIHAPGGARVGGGQRRAGQHSVDIAQDRLGLVQPVVAVIENGDLAQGVARKMLGRAERSRPHRRQPIGRALLFQSDHHGAAVGAAGNAMDGEIGHVCFSR